MSSRATLEAATQDRKARLTKLKSLKRKQEPEADQSVGDTSKEDEAHSQSRKRKTPEQSPPPDVSSLYLSGRNYDPSVQGPKLGFENAPHAGKKTVEKQAKDLEDITRREQEEEEKQDKPFDLFKLQPKKPNWDLKRDLEKRLQPLNVKTDNAIAKLVRERIAKSQAEAKANAQSSNSTNGSAQRDSEQEDQAIGMEGASLVEATRELEREDREELESEEEA